MRNERVMRKKGAISQLNRERDKDLYRRYRCLAEKHLRLYGRISQGVLLREVVDGEADRYWISAERAYSVVSQLKRGRMPFNGKNITRLYRSLYKDFCDYKAGNPGVSDKRAVEEVVCMKAPCFGVEPRVAGMIIYRMKKERRMEMAARRGRAL